MFSGNIKEYLHSTKGMGGDQEEIKIGNTGHKVPMCLYFFVMRGKEKPLRMMPTKSFQKYKKCMIFFCCNVVVGVLFCCEEEVVLGHNAKLYCRKLSDSCR